MGPNIPLIYYSSSSLWNKKAKCKEPSGQEQVQKRGEGRERRKVVGGESLRNSAQIELFHSTVSCRLTIIENLEAGRSCEAGEPTLSVYADTFLMTDEPGQPAPRSAHKRALSLQKP